MHKSIIEDPQKIKYLVVAFSSIEKDKEEEDILEMVLDKQQE